MNAQAPPPKRPVGSADRIRSALGLPGAFLIAMVGIVLVAVPPNPPETLLHWIQVVVGASFTAIVAVFVGLPELERLRIWALLARWLRWKSIAVAAGVTVVLAAVVLFGVPPAAELGRGLTSAVLGCSPATQLRMVAGPETVTTARQLASEYERWTADRNHACPTVSIYAYPGPTSKVRDQVRMVDGWSDTSGALREIGPRPDIWLATTSRELDGLETQSGPNPIAERTPIAFSPVVLAVPEPVAKSAEGGSWSEIFRRVTEQGSGVVRADPGSTELGLLATELLYGPTDQDGQSGPEQLTPVEIERRIESSLDRGGYRIGDTPGLLCRQRGLGARNATPAEQPGTAGAAVIASEQQVIRFNRGDPLGASCATASDRLPVGQRLIAVYPTDTRSLDHQFVRLSWSYPAQEQAAARFGDWLRSDPGRAAVVRTGLRPVGSYAIASPLTAEYGIRPGATPATEPIPADRLRSTATAYDAAQRRGRVLFALDTSGSMAADEPEGTRLAVAASAVDGALQDMGPLDEFGLWFFPDPAGTGHVQAVPLGPREPGRLAAARAALKGAMPAGGTPLFRAMIDGAAALAPGDPAQVNAVVVLSDGEDTTSGVTATAVRDALAGRGVRVVVVTIGEIRCSDDTLRTVTTVTAGECIDADPSNLTATVRAAVARLWGGS